LVAANPRVRIIFNHLERERSRLLFVVVVVVVVVVSVVILFPFSPPLSHSLALAVRVASRATGTGFRGIFFFRPRFLGGDLMELKSFRDAHRCALLLPRNGDDGDGVGVRDSLGVKIAHARKRKAPIADQRSGKLIIVHEGTRRGLLVTARPQLSPSSF